MSTIRICLSILRRALFIPVLVNTAFAANTIRVPADQPTIQAAINAASTGDTVLVAPGTYYENLLIDSKEIILTSEQGAAKTILDGGQRNTTLTIRNTPSLATNISGFTIQNGKNASDQIAGGLYVSNGGATISNMTFDKTNSGQVFVQNGSITLSSSHLMDSTTKCQADVINLQGVPAIVDTSGAAIPTQILGNLIEGDGTICTGAGIRTNAGDLLVANNIIRYNAFGITAYSTGVIVRQNLIYGNRASALFLGHPPVSGPATDPADFLVINNTFFNNVSPNVSGSVGAIFLVAEYAKIAFVNNIVAENSSVPALQCFPYTNYTPVIFDHNDIYNALGPVTDNVCPTPPTANGNISANPSFASSTDFHLNPGSLGIDAGNNSAPALPTTDLSNNPRIQDSTGLGYSVVDMGAYESTGTQNTTTSVLTLASSAYYLSPGSITLTAAVLPANSPSRSVSFYQDGTFLSAGVLTPSAPSSTTVNLTKPGVYSFTAKLDAVPGFSPAVSVVIYVYVTQPVSLPSTTILAATPNPANTLQPITLTAAVSGSGTSIPTGTVTFYDGTQSISSSPLDNTGHASYITSSLTPGTHLLHAVYGGDTTFASSTSTNVYETLQLIQTSTTLSIAPSPAVAQQITNVTVQVAPINSPQYSSMLCLCTVTLTITGLPPNVSPAYTLPVHNGVATFNFGLGFGAGTYTFTAAFSGSTNFAASNSVPVQQVVAPAPTAITLTAAPNPILQHQSVNFNAVITAPLSSTIANGVITFLDGTLPIGSAPFGSTGPIPVNQLSNTATVNISTSALTAGTHTITATYAGSANFLPSASTPLTITVNPQDYTLTTPNPTITIKTEHHLAIKVNLASVGGFTDNIALGCTNLPAHASCTFDKNALTLLPDGTATTDLTIDTDDVRGYARNESPGNTNPLSYALLLPPGLFLLAAGRRRRSPIRLLLIFGAISTLTFTLNGCSGLYPKSTAPGVYTINITGTGANSGFVHSQTITLTVTP